MPTLEITDEGSYFVRTNINYQIITYQVRDMGVTFLNKHGIQVGQCFTRELLQELRKQQLIFTNGTGTSHIPVINTSIKETPRSQQMDSYQTINVIDIPNVAINDENTKERVHVVNKDFLPLIDHANKFNRHGTFFKKQQRYIQMDKDEKMAFGTMYCIVFYGLEGHKIVPFPDRIKTICIGRHNVWVAWEFSIPKQLDADIRQWSICIEHPIC